MNVDIDTFLANDESVISEYKSRKQRFYATDRRLIWTLRGNFLDASYNHVNTIGMQQKRYKALMVFGIILFLLGIAIAAIGLTGGGIALLVIGIIFLILFFAIRRADYSISLSSGQMILVPKTKTANVEDFIKAIRSKIR